METFTPIKNPVAPAGKSVTYNVRSAKFGDGYTARAPLGINNKEITASYVWAQLTGEEADSIEAFFDARQGSEAFYYTPPGEIVATKFICTDFQRTRYTGLLDRITANFVKVNDL